jgi:hypothetical protein
VVLQGKRMTIATFLLIATGQIYLASYWLTASFPGIFFSLSQDEHLPSKYQCYLRLSSILKELLGGYPITFGHFSAAFL